VFGASDGCRARPLNQVLGGAAYTFTNRKSFANFFEVCMPNRAHEFQVRFKAKFPGNWTQLHVYNVTTCARISQASFFLKELTNEILEGPGTPLAPSTRRDMFMFGRINSLRSSLDAIAHEIVTYYEAVAISPQEISFYNLFDPTKITLATPLRLERHIKRFQNRDTCIYLTKLRNGMQHQNIAIVQVRSYLPIAANIAGVDSNIGDADWGIPAGKSVPISANRARSRPIEPPMTLPDDPQVPVDKLTYTQGRPLLGTLRRINSDTREFVLKAYNLMR
jgi:hypothetical protein